MTDRRRNLLVLGLVLGLLAASLVVVTQKRTVLGLDLRGGVELIYQAEPTPQQPVLTPETIDRAIDVMRERVDQLGVAEPEIQRTGDNQIAVALPGTDDADEAQRQVGRVAQLQFYDWEPNVIGPSGRPEPTNGQVTGNDTGAAGQEGAGTLTLFDALQRASEAEGERDDDNTHNGQFWAVDPDLEGEARVLKPRGQAIPEPADSREELLEDFGGALPEGAEVLTVPPGVVVVRAEQPDGAPAEEKSDAFYVLRDDVALRGSDIRNPEQNFNQQTNAPIVTFDFTDRGRRVWEQVTREIARRGQSQQFPGTPADAAAQHFAIVLDGELISVPFIDFEENPNGIDAVNGSQIEGGFTLESAQDLSNLLKTGALPVKLELISQSQVSATLGAESLDRGLLAGAVGLGIVALFLLLFYRALGVIAVAALAVYSIYLFALIKLIPITLTLPGLAGLILTIGVAADANIVIFERVKEEIRGGRSILSGIATGYRKGITAIFDANVVTIMVAFILFVLATAGVKGFALTLGVGTIVSLFTAVLATSAALGLTGRTRLFAKRGALGAAGEGRPIRFDFMGASKWFFSVSGVILAMCAIGLAGNGVNFGIDFESGTRIRAALERPANEGSVRDAVARAGVEDAEVQRVVGSELGENAFQISTATLAPAQVTSISSEGGVLDEAFGIRGSPDTQSIGPTFGETVANSAIIAIIASLLVISVYLALRFEWKYAVPVLIALSHDILITAGVYAFLGQEVTTATVAAFLTILGFSLYDTIIVFDRIRENVPRMPRATYAQIVNRSMSEVIVRSLATSLATLMPVAALLIGGGETLNDFAIALLIGTASGTYSSVFIAGPVLMHWKEHEAIWRRRHRLVASEHGGVVPAYATAGTGTGPVDVEPAARRRTRPSLSAADSPDRGVSREEFDEMVRDLGVEPAATGTAVADREPEPEPPRADPARDLDPSEVVMRDDGGPRQRKVKNRKHGRPR